MTYVWILIPLAGIALAGFSEWLKFKRQTAAIGNTTSELEGIVASLREDVDSLRKERQALVQRIQNVEAIVTDEAWDTLGDDHELARAKASRIILPDLPDADVDESESESDDAEHIARMARRLRH